MDKVIVGIASIPERVNSLRQVIKSLQKQSLPISKYYIYLNGYGEIPYHFRYLYGSDRYTFFLSEEKGDKGDVGKFFKVGEDNGYYFSTDDDILYPYNYIETMIAGIEKYRRKKIVSLHGSILHFPLTDFYRQRKLINFKRTLLHDTPCHIGGSGVMCFHTDTVKLSLNDFPTANMADIHLGVFAQRKKIPIIVLKHRKNWVKPIVGTTANSIFQRFVRDEKKTKEMADLINTLPKWELN